ncbi:G-type lectin S-receptor-like serine/threonine-protein kinase At4g27290 [Corylus avellana]|uniref:G-type lectin S-receptor-like serine/threonine-protein kinase At4g27290 n=1 Tax=Corylus avellana TaxID=13451 RepID=UPI00286B52B2|nr:G-type lectin S-receptor-like serine/threonine-protein kinase At4g27290 [Corylus avellana]
MDAITHLFVYSVFFSLFRISITQDSITPTQSITDGGTTLVSAGGSFQLGFFSPDSQHDISGVLKVTDDGILVLLNSTSAVVWSSNASRAAENPVAQLLDTGNLVVKDRNDDDPEKFLWQSFDYPCDTLLPEMKLGWNFVTGLERFLSSWKSTDDPAQGAFSKRLDPRGLPQMVNKEGDSIKTRSGSWNGLRYTGYPQLRPNTVFEYEFVLNEKEFHKGQRALNLGLREYVDLPRP